MVICSLLRMQPAAGAALLGFTPLYSTDIAVGFSAWLSSSGVDRRVWNGNEQRVCHCRRQLEPQSAGDELTEPEPGRPKRVALPCMAAEHACKDEDAAMRRPGPAPLP